MPSLSRALPGLALVNLAAWGFLVAGCTTPPQPPTPERGLEKMERQSGAVEGRLPNAAPTEATSRRKSPNP